MHTATHDQHLQVLEKVFERLHANHLKVNLEKCVFGNQEVSGPLPPDALHAFKILQQQLTSDPVMAFPRADLQYALITDAATGTSETPGGLGAILTQIDQQGNHYAISFASRQLKDPKKIILLFYSRLLLLFEAWMFSTSI